MASSKSSTSVESASLSGTPRRGMRSNVSIKIKDKETKAENSVSLFGTQSEDVKEKSSYKTPEEQQKYVLSKLFKDENPIDNAIATASFFKRNNQVPETSINFFNCRENYGRKYFGTEVPKAGGSTAPKPTPSTGIETEAVHSAKPLIKRETKQKATTEPNPEQQPIPQDLHKEKVASHGLKVPPIPCVEAATLEELSHVWEALKDKEDRITEWNYAVRTWCWLKYQCK